MKNSENKALGKRGEESRGVGLERTKSVVMADVSKYLKACGGSCGGKQRRHSDAGGGPPRANGQM